MTRTWRDIQDDSSKANRIIVADSGLIVKAADPIDINFLGQRSPCQLAFAGRLCEPSIEIRFENAIEKSACLFRGGNPRQPKLLNQTVLECIKQSLDASFGLRRERKDRFNTQLS